MPRRKHISDEEIREALVRTFGVRSAAAHALGISPATLGRRLIANPELAISEDDAKQLQDDEVLRSMSKRAMAGDVQACIWWARNQMGWTYPEERPVRTPQKMPFLQNCQFKLTKEEPE